MSVRHLSNGDDARRAVVLRVLLLLTVVFGLALVPINLLQDRWPLALAEVVMMAYAGVLHRLLARGLPVRRAIWAYLLPFLVVLLLALATAANASVFVWVLLIPILSHRLLGRRDSARSWVSCSWDWRPGSCGCVSRSHPRWPDGRR